MTTNGTTEGVTPRPRNVARLLWLGAGILLLMAAGAGVWYWRQSTQTSGAAFTSAKIGAPAPEIALAQLQNGQPGPRLALSSFRGRPVVVNFWATWCVPCRAEFPALDAKYRQYKDSQQLIVLGVDAQNDAGADGAQKFIGEMGATFPIWLDDGSAESAYDIRALPTTIFIDRQGIVRDILLGGPMTEEYLESELKKVFE